MTLEGEAKYNRRLNETFLANQNVTIKCLYELKIHCEGVQVVRQKHRLYNALVVVVIISQYEHHAVMRMT